MPINPTFNTIQPPSSSGFLCFCCGVFSALRPPHRFRLQHIIQRPPLHPPFLLPLSSVLEPVRRSPLFLTFIGCLYPILDLPSPLSPLPPLSATATHPPLQGIPDALEALGFNKEDKNASSTHSVQVQVRLTNEGLVEIDSAKVKYDEHVQVTKKSMHSQPTPYVTTHTTPPHSQDQGAEGERHQLY